ncbi:MAG: glycosyltransferase family 4 protein [Patescibacteria group bacterium]
MKILSLGLDNSILDKTSALAERTIEYGNLVEKYTVIVPSLKNEEIELSERVKVYSSGGGNKIEQFIKVYNLAKKLLKEGKYDVITVQDQYYLALIGVCLAKKFKVGLEIQVHGFEKYYGLRKIIAGYVLPRANAARCVSQRLKKQLIDQFGVKEKRITVVPIRTELRIMNNESRIKKDTGKFIFLTVGRLVKIKNISLQIAAMAEIVKDYSQAELWIVGDGPEYNNLKFKIENLKLGSRVKLLGQKDKEELFEFYAQADSFILTSDSEGWGLAVIEAASYSLPIIMTDVGCAGEVIKNNDSGIIIPVGNRQSLIQAMEALLSDEVLRQRISEGVKQVVMALPSKQETLNLYLASWQKAVEKNKF